MCEALKASRRSDTDKVFIGETQTGFSALPGATNALAPDTCRVFRVQVAIIKAVINLEFIFSEIVKNLTQLTHLG